MGDELDKTIKIRREAKVGTDDRGRTVWTKPIETVELELVSTAMLEQLLETGDEAQRERIRKLAETDSGILAIDPTSRELETISDADLESALKAADAGRPAAPGAAARRESGTKADMASVPESRGADELSLVTTQMLRKILAGEDPGAEDGEDAADAKESKGPPRGYNPYDRG